MKLSLDAGVFITWPLFGHKLSNFMASDHLIKIQIATTITETAKQQQNQHQQHLHQRQRFCGIHITRPFKMTSFMYFNKHDV